MPREPSLRRLFYLQFIGIALAGVALAWAARRLPVLEKIASIQQSVAAMQMWSGFLYPLFFGLCNVLLLPAGIVAIGSGLFFGLWWGFALNMAGNTFGAAIAFHISRKIGRGRIEKWVRRQSKWIALDEAIGREGWKIIFLSQVHPLFPTSLLNYLYGITRIPFGRCMLWIAIGQAPGLFLYAYIGTIAQLGLRLARGQTHPQAHEYVVWLGGLALSIVSTGMLGRMALRLLREAESRSTRRDSARQGLDAARRVSTEALGAQPASLE